MGVERLPADEDTSRLGAGLWPLMNMFLSFVACTSVRVFAGVFAAARTCVAVGDARGSELVVGRKRAIIQTRNQDDRPRGGGSAAHLLREGGLGRLLIEDRLQPGALRLVEGRHGACARRA